MSFVQRLLLVLCAVSGVVLLGGTASPALARQVTPTCTPYTAQLGDTPASVAARFGTTVARLAADNGAIAFAGGGWLPPGASVRICTATGATPHALSASTTLLAGQPCQSTDFWPGDSVNTDTLPPGCYAGDYRINPSDYPHVAATFGGCDWWPQALHPTWDIWSLPKHTTPRVGAVIWFAGGEQGAASEGHWGVVVAISNDGRLILSSEMNTTYYDRTGHGGTQGGYGHVIYRYIWNDPPRTLYVYP